MTGTHKRQAELSSPLARGLGAQSQALAYWAEKLEIAQEISAVREPLQRFSQILLSV